MSFSSGFMCFVSSYFIFISFSALSLFGVMFQEIHGPVRVYGFLILFLIAFSRGFRLEYEVEVEL